MLVHDGLAQRALLVMDRSKVTFVSEAPLERITAVNTSCNGLLDRDERTFAVKIPIVAFQGFNAPLQREHFNENYMVSARFPFATFQGRLIETFDLGEPGTHAVRAKGTLTIRGQARERILPCTVTVDSTGARIVSTFDVVLEDHGIQIPRVVQRKIAATVRVDVDVHFAPQTGER